MNKKNPQPKLPVVSRTAFAQMLATDLNISKLTAEKFLKHALDTIVHLVATDKEVRLTGFGTFHKTRRTPRNGVNPKTGKPIIIPAYSAANFKLGKTFRESVRNSK